MMKRNHVLLMASMFAMFFLLTVTSPALGKEDTPEYAPGELLVKLKSGLKTTSGMAAFETLGMAVLKYFPRSDVYHLKLGAGEAVPDAIARLQKNPNVLYAEPNYLYRALSTFPDDPMFSNLWGLDNTGQTGGTPDADIDAPEAWDISTGSASVVVCVIDTGVKYDHEDLAANMWTNPAEADGAPGLDDDGNGYVDDIHGINAVAGTGDPMDEGAHGTHCAGTIAAVGNNGIGVTGVNWNARIMACNFLGAAGVGTLDDAIECIEYATEMGANVTSNSWGGGPFSQAMKDAIEAANQAGILFVAAAGNWGNNNDTIPHYPSSFDNTNIIAVAATNHSDLKAGFSNYGLKTVDVGAPGVDILSTFLPGAFLTDGCNDNDGDGYGYCSGTSMACPHVAGLVALAMASHPSETYLEIKSRIMRTTDPLPDLTGKVVTGGRINAYRAVTESLVGPHIYYLDPPHGYVGDTITIVGSNFGTIQGPGVVTFTSGLAAVVKSWNDVQIEVEVPEAVHTGDVTVTTDEGMSNGITFTLLLPYYTRSVVPHQFTGAGDPTAWHDEDACWSYMMPFDFPYFGTSYGTIYVCTNGFLDFTSSDPLHLNSQAALRSRAMIAPLWDDLVINGADEGIFIHQPSADSVAFRWAGRTYSGNNPVNVEAILNKDGAIQFNYGDGNEGLTPTIGISMGDGLHWHLSAHNNQGVLTNVESELYAPACVDGDEDGYGTWGTASCPNPEMDCDDSNPVVNPGAVEIPGNGLDDDCNSNTPSWGTPASQIGAIYSEDSNIPNHLIFLIVPTGYLLILKRLKGRGER